MKHTPRFALVIMCATFLSACQVPVVPEKSIKYSVSYLFDGRSIQVNETYNCYLDAMGWIWDSEAGAFWHFRDRAQIFMKGTFPDGTAFLIEPLDNRTL